MTSRDDTPIEGIRIATGGLPVAVQLLTLFGAGTGAGAFGVVEILSAVVTIACDSGGGLGSAVETTSASGEDKSGGR